MRTKMFNDLHLLLAILLRQKIYTHRDAEGHVPDLPDEDLRCYGHTPVFRVKSTTTIILGDRLRGTRIRDSLTL